MAKGKVRGLDEALNEIFAEYEKSLYEAMKYATREASGDIKREAEGCLSQYYINYTQTWYDRTENLLHAFVPYGKIQRGSGRITALAGISYDPSRLDGLYNSNGSEKYMPVPGEYILENYLAGIHPRTNGYPIWNSVLEFDNVVDAESPDAHMDKYCEEYMGTFRDYIYEWFADQISGR